MMWFIIILMIVVVIILFSRSMKKMEQQIEKDGGMKNRFAILIDLIMSGDPRTKILKEGRHNLVIGLSVMGSFTTFELINTFSSITIIYRTNNVLFGKQKLDWEFPVNMDQEQMYFLINKDIASFVKKNYNIDLNI